MAWFSLFNFKNTHIRKGAVKEGKTYGFKLFVGKIHSYKSCRFI